MRGLKILLIGVCCLAFATSSRAQQQQQREGKWSTVSDSTIQAQQDTAWAQFRRYFTSGRSAKADSVQRLYADRFFQYYRAHPETDTGQEVLEAAFVMWGNMDAAEAIDEAMPKIDEDAAVWGKLIHGIGNAYYGAGRSRDDFIGLLRWLETRLTHPKAWTALWMSLADENRETRPEKAKAYYEKVVAADADSFRVAKAKDQLYALENLRVGQQAPDFQTKTIEGESIDLSKLQGKVVLLDFWATTCGPCIPEIPHLKEIRSRHSGDAFQLVGISHDDSFEALKQFLDQRGMAWPQIREPVEWKGEVVQFGTVSERYNVYAIPQTYLIDRSGQIVAKDLRGEELERVVAETVNPPASKTGKDLAALRKEIQRTLAEIEDKLKAGRHETFLEKHVDAAKVESWKEQGSFDRMKKQFEKGRGKDMLKLVQAARETEAQFNDYATKATFQPKDARGKLALRKIDGSWQVLI